jgi:DNA-binding transcriptional ArsR family regulator
MSTTALDMAEIAHLIGDVARANILSAMLDGRASTALELSLAARVTPQTTSAHLAKLVDGRLLTVDRQGRHRYFRLASPAVARTLEQIMALAAEAPPPHRRPARMDAEMRRARTCYDHIAGEIGVAITGSLLDRGHVLIEGDAGEVTPDGRTFFAGMGVDLTPGAGSRRVFCRPCLDWSERQPHLGGHVGAAIAKRCLACGWIERRRGSRTLTITAAGRAGLPATFGAALAPLCEPVQGARRLPM